MPTFLVKTEPADYSFDDLVRDGRTQWTGVSNPAALGHLRSMAKGDEVLIYHTGNDKSIVGLARVVRPPYADPKRPGLNARTEIAHPVVDLAPVRKADCPVALARLKADARFKDFALVRNSRLSVMPVPAPLDRALRTIAGLD